MPKSRIYRRASAIGLALLIVLGGCQLGVTPTASEDGNQLTLAIDAGTAGRFVSVDYLTIAELDLSVYDLAGNRQFQATWVPGQSPDTYDVPLPGIGMYLLVVTHRSRDGSAVVEAVEDAEFAIRPMVITRITVVPGQIGLIVIDTDPGPKKEEEPKKKKPLPEVEK